MLLSKRTGWKSGTQKRGDDEQESVALVALEQEAKQVERVFLPVSCSVVRTISFRDFNKRRAFCKDVLTIA